MNQIEINITLQPKQREAMDKSETTPVLFYGGSKGSGKSYLVRAREVKRRLLYRGTKGLIVRKTFPELLANHIRPFFKEYPITRQWYNKAEKTIYWPNGSTTEFSYLGNTDDVYTYQGREYDDEAIDEVTQHDWEVVRILRSSLRTTNPQIKPTMLLTGNPGGVGHQEVKRIFIDRKFRPDENPEDYAFVQAFVQDNNALMDGDPQYVKRLEDLPDHLRRAYLLGDWNIFAGQAFPELARHVHIIPPFALPEPVRWFAGYDWGHEHPFAFVLCGMTHDKKIYVTGYVHAQHKNIEQQALMIKNLIGDKKPIIYLGHDAFQDRGHPTIARQLQQALPGLQLLKATTKRIHGVSILREQIAYQNTTKGYPNLKFFKNAEGVYDQVASMQYDDKKPEDALKMDANDSGEGGDDLYDACFVKNTKIRVVGGIKNIQDVTNRDVIFTSRGVRATSGVFCSGHKKVSILITNKGKIIIATNNHPIKTPDGFVRLDTLRYGDIIETWEKHKQSSLTALLLGDTQNRPENILRNIITRVETIRKEGLRHYIGKYGKSITGTFQRVWTSIIKIITHQTMKFLTYSSYLKKNIINIIKDHLKIFGNTLRTSGHLRLSGTSQKRGQSGIKNTTSKLKTSYLLKGDIPAYNAEIRSSRSKKEPSFAPTSVSRGIVGRLGLIMWCLFARGVGKVLKLTNTPRRDVVPEYVFGLIENVGESDVYNLEVEKDHEYFANDILVHNCRYALASYLSPLNLPDRDIDKTSGEYLMRLIENEGRKTRALSHLI